MKHVELTISFNVTEKDYKKSIEDYIMIGVGVAVLTITVVGITLGIIYN